jgi:predicted MFS family arabinose efflux permease
VLWPSAGSRASVFVFGCGAIVWTISSTTLRQTVTPGALLGRVSAIFLTGNAGARPLGAALGGLVGAHWGEAACLGLAVLAFALQLALIARPAISRLHALPPQEI